MKAAKMLSITKFHREEHINYRPNPNWFEQVEWSWW